MREHSDRYRRQQRRRAVIAWVVGVPFALLFVAGCIALGGKGEKEAHEKNPFGYEMTAKQYAALRPGLEEQLFVDRLGETGLPENLTKHRYTRLFPSHGDAVACTYWAITDREGMIARVCFSNPQGLLVQKLERRVAPSPPGVST